MTMIILMLNDGDDGDEIVVVIVTITVIIVIVVIVKPPPVCLQIPQVPEAVQVSFRAHGGQDLLQRDGHAVLQVHQEEDVQATQLVGKV